MENDKPLIMVTWDFTEKSEFALEHAVKMATAVHGEIAAVHIVKKDTEMDEVKSRMEYDIRKRFPDPAIVFHFLTRPGSIFHTIGEIATEINAMMVVMGTHGIIGMQKLLGSWALKVIASSKVPFVVVQEAPKSEPMKNIVLPINYKKETKECIGYTHQLHKKFGSTYHIFKARYTDSNFRKGQDSNMFFITKYFNSKGIPYEVSTETGEGNFGSDAIQYAKTQNADAILIMTTRDIGFTDFVLGSQEQSIIANNERIPVICINPRPAKLGGGFSASGG